MPYTQVLTDVNLNRHVVFQPGVRLGRGLDSPVASPLPAHHNALSLPGEETVLVKPSRSLLRSHRQ